nr:DUF1403 family protein [Methylocystis hirsuta]
MPRWAKGDAGAQGRRQDDALGGAGDAQFFAGAALALLDHILHSGPDVSSAGKSSAEPPFAGALRQRLALRAATACARIARLREDEPALRDAEHLASFDAALTPGGRLHRLWRLFATRPARLDAPFMRAAADCLEVPPHIDCEALAVLVRESLTTENPLNAATRVSTAALHILTMRRKSTRKFLPCGSPISCWRDASAGRRRCRCWRRRSRIRRCASQMVADRTPAILIGL